MKTTESDWLLHHSAHDYTLLVARWQSVAEQSGLEIETLLDQEEFPVLVLKSSAVPVAGGLYFSAGVHGDEPAAVWGLLEWAEANIALLQRESIMIFPCVNPWGFANNIRVDREGQDLNRLFQNDTLPLFSAWRQRIGEQRFRLAVNLHEDYDAQGIYVYELVPEGGQLCENIFTQVATIIPRDQRATIEGQQATGGILSRSGDFREVVNTVLDGGWPEAIQLYMTQADVALTFETPSEFAFHQRVQAQQRFITAALQSVEANSNL